MTTDEDLRTNQRSDRVGQGRRADRRRDHGLRGQEGPGGGRQGGGRGHDRHLRADVLVGLLPELRALQAQDPHVRGLGRGCPGLRGHRGGGRLPRRDPTAPRRPGQHVPSRRVPLRRRPRHRGPRRGQNAPALRPVLRDGRLPAPRDPHVLHDPRPQPGHHGQPAQLLPELQRGDQRLGSDDLHVPGHAGAPPRATRPTAPRASCRRC